jgi:alcohol dehydrogenase class IV
MCGGIEWLRETCTELEIPSLRTYGIGREDFGEIAQRAAMASSMKANPVALTTEELLEILERAC